jgi:hypothetical protein
LLVCRRWCRAFFWHVSILIALKWLKVSQGISCLLYVV